MLHRVAVDNHCTHPEISDLFSLWGKSYFFFSVHIGLPHQEYAQGLILVILTSWGAACPSNLQPSVPAGLRPRF